MAHHKRGKCKNARSGCIMCKPHKNPAFKDSLYYQTRQEKRARLSELEQTDGAFRQDPRQKAGASTGDVCSSPPWLR